ncbi:MAG: alpha-galactosidase [Kiritimatiellae bacterium]|nr:alpha-galactosidase [Kiritimatiellia bacterium]
MPINIDEQKKLFLLSTDNSSYAFGLDEKGIPVNLHWGGRIERTADLPEPGEVSWHNMGHYKQRSRRSRDEFPVYGRDYLVYEPCLKVREPDEFTALQFQYTGHVIDGEHLAATYRSPAIRLTMHYEAIPECDLLNRWVEVVNEGNKEIVLENLFSAAWHVPRCRKYRLTHLHGAWGKEYQVKREMLGPGEKVLQGRAGISGHNHVPFFALDEDGRASEKEGIVWFGALQWSGSWKMIVASDSTDIVRVVGGLNNYDFELALAPGESFSAPVFTGGFTREGFGGASRQIHRYQQKYLYPGNMRGKVMPTVFNTYSCIRGKQVTENNVMELIPLAAKVGIELFIIDAGWQQSMGDWTVDKVKFPDGFKNIIDAVHKNGMQFGLWLEFERVDAASKIYHQLPEWRIDNANYSLWNFALPDVLEYIYGVLKQLLTENDIAYFKVDLNRLAISPEAPDRRRMNVKYVRNVYELFRRLRADFPGVFFENCAEGSGRPDLKMDEFFARINRSDNQDTLDILNIHEGFTYLHPSKMAGGGCHISEDMTYLVNHRIIPTRFMAHAAVMSWFALGMPLNRSTAEELAEYRQYVELYKKVRHIVALGEIHRLAAYGENFYAAFEYVLPDASEALLCVFGHGIQFNRQLPNLLLEALDPEGIYGIDIYGKHPSPRDAFCNCEEPAYRPCSGRGLMEIGVRVLLNGDLDSRILHFKKQG